MMVCVLCVLGCAGHAVMLKSNSLESPKGNIESLMIFLQTYPTWNEGYREALASNLESAMSRHGISCTTVILSEERLNEDEYIREQLEKHQPQYTLHARQAAEVMDESGTPDVTFQFALALTESGVTLWNGEIETRPARVALKNPLDRTAKLGKVGGLMAARLEAELSRLGFIQ